MSKANQVEKEDILRAVVEEVDHARETYVVVEQLAPHLPIESYEELHESLSGTLEFRGSKRSLPEELPVSIEFLFPIAELDDLVALVAFAVRNAPPGMRYDLSDPEVARRVKRRAFFQNALSVSGELKGASHEEASGQVRLQGEPPPDDH